METNKEPEVTSEETGAAGQPWHEKTRRWLDQRKIALGAYGLALTFLAVLLWPFMVISIHSGEVGVLYSRLFGGTVMNKVYQEGVHIILPWDIMFRYNIRLQQENVDISVLSRGGLTVNMKASVYFYPVHDHLSELHRDIGPEYKDKLIMPIVTSSIRNTVGSYWPEDLYTSAPLKLQDEIMVQAVEQLGRRPVVIDSVVVRSITLPKQVNDAIDLKFSAEQEYLRYKYVLLKAREELKQRYIQAESVRLFQDTVNRGLTENFLRWSGIEATKELAASPNAKFVIVSGPGGLPVILNTEPMPKGLAQKNPPEQIAAPEPQVTSKAAAPDNSTLKKRLRDIEESLKRFNSTILPEVTRQSGMTNSTAEEK